MDEATDRFEEQIVARLAPLLGTLEALAHAARHFHPPEIEKLLARLGAPDAALKAALADAEPVSPAWSPAWPAALAAVSARIDLAADHAIQAFAELRGAAEDWGDLSRAHRALRRLPQALEALYPLAAFMPPINAFFLDADRRGDPGFEARFLGKAPAETGVTTLGDGSGGRGETWVYAPETYTADTPHPLVMALHGGRGDGRSFLWSWLRTARSRGAILVAPTSLGPTWALSGEDRDTPRLAAILEQVRDRWTIDPSRLLLTGMSDGGTFCYLSGLESGSFTHLAPVAAAFHPMFAAMAEHARLRDLPIRITHGALDWMFPIEQARSAAQALGKAGAPVALVALADLSHAYPSEQNGPILDWLAETA